jgi:hypothetical protein
MTDKDREKYYQEQETLKEEIEKKHGKSTTQLYEEREQRASDVIDLKVPDRVPLTINADFAKYTNVPRSASYYDPISFKRATRYITVSFEPDLVFPGLTSSGAAMEALGVTNRLWPGGNLPPDYRYQFQEMEYMKEGEYDMYLNDPTDFMIRRFLPRMYESLVPLMDLPPLGMMMQGFEGITTIFATPEFRKVAEVLAKAGEENRKFRELIGNSYEDLAYLGFPPFSQLGLGGIGGAPFDTVSSFLRGMQGSMVDMYRRPEKLIQLCDMILDRRIAQAVAPQPQKSGRPIRVGMPLWRGDKSFMSQQQFEKFYWPGLRRALQAVIDLGGIPIPFFEAEFGERLERLYELPKGKVIASVEYEDLPKARDILKGHHCILVRGPFSLEKASPGEIVACYKDIFDKYGKGGGLMINIRLPDNTGVNEIIKMLDEIREYVRY